VIEPHRALAVDVQERDAGSLLNFYRTLLRWRKTQPALVSGTLRVLPAHPQVLAFVRAFEGTQMLCVFNFSDSAVSWELPSDYVAAVAVQGSGLADVPRAANMLQLPAWGGAYYRLG
jgi:alpha-glucosidase